jgi:hypothetical protein
MRKPTLAKLYASLAALRYSRACRSFDMPDFESKPTFISLALLDVRSDEIKEREVLTE